MSSAFKTLTTSDFVVIPYKAVKTLEYTSCSIFDAGFTIHKGINTPVNISGSLPSEALYYYSAKHLYYTYNLSASLDSGSGYDDSLQSTAASGTYQADLRIFPTGSDATVKILSVPQGLYGEAIHPKSFKLISETGDYYIVDDGNGNLVDIVSCGGTTSTPDSEIYNTDMIYSCIASGSTIGNIIYPQGILIITNPDYDCLFDLGPTTSDIYEVFLSTDTPKQIQVSASIQTDCSAIDYSTLTVYELPGEPFPDYTIVNGVIELDDADPLSTTEGTYLAHYGVKSAACAASNTSSLVVSIIDCTIIGGTITVVPSPTPTQTPTYTPTPTATQTPTLTITPTQTQTPTQTPTSTATPAITPSITPTSTETPTATPTSTVTPSITPTNTPTPSPYSVQEFNLCVETINSELPPYFVQVNSWTIGDAWGNLPTTNVTVTFDIFITTQSNGTQIYRNQTVVVPAYSTTSNTKVFSCPSTVVSVSAYILSVSPTSNPPQNYIPGTVYTSGCST